MNTTLIILSSSLCADPSLHLWSDQLGVGIDLPPQAQIIERPDDGNNAYLVRQATEDKALAPSWSLRIESLETESDSATDNLFEILNARLGDQAPSEQPLLLSLQGREGAVIWVNRPLPDDRVATLGWMAVPQALGRCLLISAVTTPEAGTEVLQSLESAMATTRLLDGDESETGLHTNLSHGRDIVNEISPDQLKSLDGQDHVLRVYQNTPEGETELAYGTLHYELATRNKVTEAASITSDNIGLLVTTHLRMVVNAEAGIFVDRVQRCWLALDMSEEVWLDEATRIEDGLRTKSSELGIRSAATTGSPAGRLMIIREDSTHGTRDSQELIPGDPWLPRGLRWAIWDLVPEEERSQASWFVWDDSTSVPNMTLRHDRWTKEGRCWSWAGLDGLPTGLNMGPNGRWTRADRPGGVVIEVADQDTVISRWQAAGLPLR